MDTKKKVNGSLQKHSLLIDKPTTLYLFSDGYQDQSGGTNHRRFMASRLHRILFEMHHKPMVKQKKILNKVIDFWMKNNKQNDDILVLGIRLEL